MDFFPLPKLQYLEGKKKKFHILIVYNTLYEEAILNASYNIIYILYHKYYQELIKSVNHNINIVTKLYINLYMIASLQILKILKKKIRLKTKVIISKLLSG